MEMNKIATTHQVRNFDFTNASGYTPTALMFRRTTARDLSDGGGY